MKAWIQFSQIGLNNLAARYYFLWFGAIRGQIACTCLDLDAVKFGGKLVIDCKHVAILDLLGLGLLGENSLSGLPTSQRLQRSHQLPLWDVCLLLDLL